MQIVIDVSEEEYDAIKSGHSVFVTAQRGGGKSLTIDLIKAVRNGTPLPKGHGRLIDADAVEKEMNKSEVEADRNADYYTADKIDCAMEYIINAQTIIEADKEGQKNDKR